MILVQRVVDRRHLSLAEQVVQRRIDRLHRDTQASGGVTVDAERRLNALVLLIGVDVREGRQIRHRLPYLRLPCAKLREVVGLQCELVLRIGRATADPDILRRLQEQVCSRLLRQSAAQARDHEIGRIATLRKRFQ